MKTTWMTVAGAVVLSTLVGCSADKAKPAAQGPADDTQTSPVSPPSQAEAPAAAAASAAPVPMPAADAKGRAEASPKHDSGASARRGRMWEQPSKQPVDRPGLGTEWGETRSSRIDSVTFVRADASNPIAKMGLFYNDEQGARLMASAADFRRFFAAPVPVVAGAVQVGLKGERGQWLSGFTASDKTFVVGEAGQRYTIVLHNFTSQRVEAVVSVDGLDVMDGKPASFAKRGYILDPRADLEIDGFRQSTETVAAFRFGAVKNSYAEKKHGDSRNVGVIGVALFHERGSNAQAFAPDTAVRQHANPFPAQFASAP